MPLDAPMTTRNMPPPRGSAGAFRWLTAQLKCPPLPPRPAEAAPAPPAGATPPAGPGSPALQLLDIVWGAVNLPPQERSLAGDTLLLLLPLLSDREVALLADRVAAMDQPPPLLVSRMLRDPRPEVGGVVLERSMQIEQADLVAACREGAVERLRLIARRKRIPAVVAHELVLRGDLASLRSLLRNPGAEISFATFLLLSQMAGEHASLQAPLVLRADLPLAVAVDLIWRLPPELRRMIIARFLSDSVTLGRILAIGHGLDEKGAAVLPAQPPPEVDAALERLLAGDRDDAARRLAAAAGLAEGTALRIFSDSEGEALAVLFKALGLGGARFAEVLEQLRARGGAINAERPVEELRAVFDALSFSTARVLLVYWDWFSRGVGPYAPADAAGLVEAEELA